MVEEKENKENKHLYQVYIASPFFNEEQIERLNRVREVVENFGYFKIWDVYHNGIIIDEKNKFLREEAFKENLRQIRKSDILIAITDDKDMGTIFELGYGYNYCEIIIGYAETLGEKKFNLMLAQSCSAIAKNIQDLKEILKRILEHRDLSEFQYEGEIE